MRTIKQHVKRKPPRRTTEQHQQRTVTVLYKLKGKVRTRTVRVELGEPNLMLSQALAGLAVDAAVLCDNGRVTAWY